MPKFVPVKDSEKPLSEQDHESNAKHRQFDNPFQLNNNHNVKKKPAVDRGWEQGNVGWGVLGSHGSNQKDNIAQIIRRSEGVNKMVKNDKGLWVKSKECETESSVNTSSQGRGRGSGIPAFNYDSIEIELSTSSSGELMKERKVIHDEFDYKGGRSRYQDPSSIEIDYVNKIQKRDRDDDERYPTTTSRKRTEDRDHKGYDDRSKSHRSRSRSRDRNDKQYSKESRETKRERRDSRDRYQRRRDSRDRNTYNNKDRDRSYDRHKKDRYKDNDVDSNHHHRKERIENDEYHHNKKLHSSIQVKDDNNDNKDCKVITTNDNKVTNDDDDDNGDKYVFALTAIQVINRFHDVFSANTLFQSDRITSIQELFTEDAIIASLKTNSCYLKGKEAIKTSFEKTTASVIEISKRLYFDNSNEVTFCLDFHRPGKAPGLGDKNKHSILLYRCKSAHITNIWGCIDQEQLSGYKAIVKEKIIYSKIYEYVKAIVLKDYLQINDSNDITFHNYDEMEVCGM